MSEAKNRADWNRTAHVLATLINVNRDPEKSKPVSPEEMNPYKIKRQRKKKPSRFVSIATIAKAFVRANR